MVIDLSQVAYIDSTGIGIIAYCFGKISQKGAQAAVAGAKGLVMEVFKLTRLDSVIHFLSRCRLRLRRVWPPPAPRPESCRFFRPAVTS